MTHGIQKYPKSNKKTRTQNQKASPCVGENINAQRTEALCPSCQRELGGSYRKTLALFLMERLGFLPVLH